MKVMYLDESGDHSLGKIDPSYPVFVLGGVIVDRTYARTVVAPRIKKIKNDYFGHDDLILHTADIIRAKNGFENLKDPILREAFYRELNVVMRELEYQVVACAIRKDVHVAQYGKNAADPYMYSLGVLVERFCEELGNVADSGFICAEKRGAELDNALDQAWANLIRRGTDDIRGAQIDKRVIDLGTKDKGLDIAGLQLADLVVSPIGRFIIGKPTREDWDIVKNKFRNGAGGHEGYGLVVLPHQEH